MKYQGRYWTRPEGFNDSADPSLDYFTHHDFFKCTCGKSLRVIKQALFYEKVIIEFEYESSTFIRYGHDPEKCDLIVCWVDDWKDCPIPVFELSSEVKKLPDWS